MIQTNLPSLATTQKMLFLLKTTGKNAKESQFGSMGIIALRRQ